MMKQLSLISLYGQKPPSLASLITRCSEFIQESGFGHIFRPYHLHQIHGTLFGMETLTGSPEWFNANIWSHTGRKEAMNFETLRETVMPYLPMTVRFGGFGKTWNGFTSFGKIPYERSFQVQWTANKVTLIGWPHRKGEFSPSPPLDNLRRDAAAKCNMRHKYDDDNDLFLVLGEITGLEILPDSQRREIKSAASRLEEKVRKFLEKNLIDVEIGYDQVFLARYGKESLPLDSTDVYCISKPEIDAGFMKSLYE
jgi:hypothetical protein